MDEIIGGGHVINNEKMASCIALDTYTTQVIAKNHNIFFFKARTKLIEENHSHPPQYQNIKKDNNRPENAHHQLLFKQTIS